MSVLDAEGKLLTGSHAKADRCPGLAGAGAESLSCHHEGSDLAWLIGAHDGPVEDRCPYGGLRRAYPLRYRDRLWGSLVTCCWDGTPGPLLHAVAALTAARLRDLVVTGYELQDLAQEIVANYEQLTLLYTSDASVGAVREVSSICERALERITSQVPAQAIAVLLLDDETGHARIAAALHKARAGTHR